MRCAFGTRRATLGRVMHISLIWLLFSPLWVQEQGPAPAPPASTVGRKPDNQAASKGTSHDRLFFTLPNFLTLENADDAPPLTPGGKFKVTARGSFDPVEFLWYGAQ